MPEAPYCTPHAGMRPWRGVRGRRSLYAIWCQPEAEKAGPSNEQLVAVSYLDLSIFDTVTNKL